MKLIVDASVAVEYLIGSPAGISLNALFMGRDVLAPALLDAEVLSVVRRECLAKRISEQSAHSALSALASWPLRRLAHPPLLTLAWEFRHSASAYDALYLAAAKAHGAILVTADGHLSRAPVRGVVIQHVARQTL